METKQCKKCGVSKPLFDFWKEQKSKDGRRAKCADCQKIEQCKYRDKQRDNINARAKASYAENPKTKARIVEYRKNNIDAVRAWAREAQKRFREQGKIKRDIPKERVAKQLKLAKERGFESWADWLVHKQASEQAKKLARKHETEKAKKPKLVCWLWNKPGLPAAEKWKTRYALDIEFQLKERLRRQLSKQKKRDGVSTLMRNALARQGNSKRAEQLLGYTMGQLRNHLERQFQDGMTWELFRQGQIHIDHIVPQAAFDMSDSEQWSKCWCLSNLRPMWGGENIAKGARQIFLL